MKFLAGDAPFPNQEPTHPWLLKEANGDPDLLALLNEREEFGDFVAKNGGLHNIPDEALQYKLNIQEAIAERKAQLGIDPIVNP